MTDLVEIISQNSNSIEIIDSNNSSIEIVDYLNSSIEVVVLQNTSIVINDITPSSIEISLNSIGSNGLTNYQVAQVNGFTGTQAQWLASLVGAASTIPGAQGIQGIQGLIGLTGAASTIAGAMGIQGIQGIKGDAGIQGITGLTGAASTIPGQTGLQGIQGLTGATGVGIAPGGLTNYALTKASNSDFDTTWTNPVAIALEAVGNISHDTTGFVNRTDSTISFVEATRTFTIAPVGASATYFYRGVEHHITSPISFVIPNVSGGIFVDIDPATNTLYNGGTNGGILTQILCAYIYWDAVNGKVIIFGDERHAASASTQWHYTQHRNVGTVWRSGGGLGYTLNSDTATSLVVGAPMTIADEDLEHVITHSTNPALAYGQVLSGAALLPVMYLSGSSYVQQTESAFPWIAGTTTARYNSITSNVGSLVDAGEGKFFSYWLFATNDTITPIKLLLGDALWDSVEGAYAETYSSYGIQLAENVPMYQIIVQTSSAFANAAKIQIAGVRLITQRSVTSAAAFSAASHDALIGRSLDAQHPISAITDLQDSLSVKQLSIVNGATRLIQTQRIMAQIVNRGQI